MPALAHRRSAPDTARSRPEPVTSARGEDNAAAQEQLAGAGMSAGPFETPFLNGALSQAFGASLGGLSLRHDAAGNEAIGARASTRGGEISLGGGVSEDPGDLDAMETLAHETAHALAGGGAGETALDRPGDPGEAQADAAGSAFRAWAAGGFQGPAPALRPATSGRAAVHRDVTTRAAVTGQPMLRLGSVGVQVRALQNLLNARGASLVADGAFGPRTQAAVIAFQRAAGLAADGIVGPQTAAALNRGGSAIAQPDRGTAPAPAPSGGAAVTGRPELSFNSRGGIVSALQRLLNAKGATLSVDGVFGAGTHQAVRAFQAANGLGVDGVVGPQTAARLNDPASARIQPGAANGRRGQFAGVDAFDDVRDAVIAAAESHLGAPYYWGADGPGTFDCSGFVLYVLRQETGLVNWGDDTAHGIRNRVPRTNTPRRGDLVFYWSGGSVQHIEIALGEGANTIGASGGGSRTFGNDPGAKVQYGNWNRDGRSKTFGSIDGLIQASRGRR